MDIGIKSPIIFVYRNVRQFFKSGNDLTGLVFPFEDIAGANIYGRVDIANQKPLHQHGPIDIINFSFNVMPE